MAGAMAALTGSKQRVGLADMPVELMSHICSFLCIHCTGERTRWPMMRQTALSRLSRTCRRLRDIAQPIIFHSFSTRRSDEHRLARLLRTLSTRPDLALHMKSLVLAEKPQHGNLCEADRLFVQAVVARLGLGHLPDHWTETEGHPLLLAELILNYTPNLEDLQIPLSPDWELGIVRHQAAKPFRFLPKLRVLEITFYYISGDRRGLSTGQITGLLSAAPSLEELRVPTLSLMYMRLPLSSLIRFEFWENCCVAPEFLHMIMVSCPHLRAFALHWDALDDPYDFVEDRRTVDAWDALALRVDTLREISLDVRGDLPLGEGDRCSLSDFAQLQVLRVDGHSLNVLRQAWLRQNHHARIDSFLSQLLPRSIRHVTFWRLDGALTDAMLRLAKVVSVGRYPNLKSVTLAPSARADRPEYDEWPNASAWNAVLDDLVQVFGKRGVRFELKTGDEYWLPERLLQ